MSGLTDTTASTEHHQSEKVMSEPAPRALCGGNRRVDLHTNSSEIDELAKFAVSEYNNSPQITVGDAPPKKLSFSKVISAHTQVVQGIMYHLVIEAEEASKPSQYEAKVWVKSWENFKKLQEFKPKVAA